MNASLTNPFTSVWLQRDADEVFICNMRVKLRSPSTYPTVNCIRRRMSLQTTQLAGKKIVSLITVSTIFSHPSSSFYILIAFYITPGVPILFIVYEYSIASLSSPLINWFYLDSIFYESQSFLFNRYINHFRVNYLPHADEALFPRCEIFLTALYFLENYLIGN